MANSDGLKEAIMAQGKNTIVKMDNSFFSLAFGNEIALVAKGNYYILNTGQSTFDILEKMIQDGTSEKDMFKYWLEQSLLLEISIHSDSFGDIREWLKDD